LSIIDLQKHRRQLLHCCRIRKRRIRHEWRRGFQPATTLLVFAVFALLSASHGDWPCFLYSFVLNDSDDREGTVRGRVWVLVGEANKDKNEAIGRPRNCWPDVWSVNSTKILLYLYLYNTCTYVLVLVRSNLDTVLVIVQYIQDVRVLVESVWSHFPHGVLTSDQESWLRGPVKTVNHSVEWFQNTISPTILLTLANASWYKYLIIVPSEGPFS
jgi:hypothetical protein